MSKKVKPEILGGFRDYLPSMMISRQEMLEKIRKVYERFGFVPLDTPGLEKSSVLGTDDPDFSMEVYRFKAGDQDVSLRFDLTVPLARVVAANPDLPRPFKRYQVGRVWRREKPQAGRYREFVQFDVDIVGPSSMLADTEIINIMYDTLRELGIERFLIRFNNRKILNGLPEYAGFEKTKIKVVLRILDKLEKIGLEKVVDELKRQPENIYDVDAPNLSLEAVKRIIDFLKISGDSERILFQLDRTFGNIPIAREGIGELAEIIQNLKALSIPSQYWKIDLSVARGLDYYTGPVFEAVLTDLPEIGSVFAGGRFDGLVGRFMEGSVPAVGASIGVDRLFAALEKLQFVKNVPTLTRVLVTVFDQLKEKSLEVVEYLRGKGINTEIYLGNESGLKSQIIYAAKQEIPFVVIVGLDEVSLGKIRLKNMNARSEEVLTVEECCEKIKN